MARVTDPLFSVSASGRIGSALLYRAGKSGPRVSRPPDPRRTNQGPPSAAQVRVRDHYSAAAESWRALSDTERESYRALAQSDRRNIHAWAIFLEMRGTVPTPEPTPEPMPDGMNIHIRMKAAPCLLTDGLDIHVGMRPCLLY